MDKNYKQFIQDFKDFHTNNPLLFANLLTNVLSCRQIGNKTHGDMAEIAFPEYINRYLVGYSSKHVGKDRFRAKSKEEDIVIFNNKTKAEIPISLKTYGTGYLQLSTDKENNLFPLLQKYPEDITSQKTISEILNSPEFQTVTELSIFPIIYNEKKQQASVLLFNFDDVYDKVSRIVLLPPKSVFRTGEIKTNCSKRLHPVYLFLDKNNDYLFEVRYGGKTANALQRGLWTHTINSSKNFVSLTNGWINFFEDDLIKNVFAGFLCSSSKTKKKVFDTLQKMLEEEYANTV